MSLLTSAQMAAIQKVGRSAMTVVCSIYKREAYGADDSNPYGDDTVTYAVTSTDVDGWLVPASKADFSVSVAQVLSARSFIVRMPVGTDIGPGDKVVIAGDTYYVSESTVDQSWPEWTTANLRRATT